MRGTSDQNVIDTIINEIEITEQRLTVREGWQRTALEARLRVLKRFLAAETMRRLNGATDDGRW